MEYNAHVLSSYQQPQSTDRFPTFLRYTANSARTVESSAQNTVSFLLHPKYGKPTTTRNARQRFKLSLWCVCVSHNRDIKRRSSTTLQHSWFFDFSDLIFPFYWTHHRCASNLHFSLNRQLHRQKWALLEMSNTRRGIFRSMLESKLCDEFRLNTWLLHLCRICLFTNVDVLLPLCFR